jgi:hypothetical protein
MQQPQQRGRVMTNLIALPHQMKALSLCCFEHEQKRGIHVSYQFHLCQSPLHKQANKSGAGEDEFVYLLRRSGEEVTQATG